jgi:integrase/recombinase XerD
MATTSTSTAVAAFQPVFTEPERLALAGVPGRLYRPDPRGVRLGLAPVRVLVPTAAAALVPGAASDIEYFARDLEARGRARATITRRLCTIAGFYRYAVEEDLLDHSPRPRTSDGPDGLRIPCHRARP